jgi:hypothetical protein
MVELYQKSTKQSQHLKRESTASVATATPKGEDQSLTALYREERESVERLSGVAARRDEHLIFYVYVYSFIAND